MFLEFFLGSLFLAQNLALHSHQKKPKCGNFEEEIFKQGLKELQLVRDVRGVGNKQTHREMKA